MNTRLKALAEAGVSIWLDDLSRVGFERGNVAGLIENDSVVGVTTNPTIFAAALSKGDAYVPQLRALGDVPTSEAIKHLCTTDPQRL